MAVLPVQNLPARNGALAPLVFTAAAASDTFDNDGRTLLVVMNKDASSKTITPTVVQDTGAMVTDTGTAITTAADVAGVPGMAMMGPFERGVFNDTAGRVTITPSATTSVSYAVVRFPLK